MPLWMDVGNNPTLLDVDVDSHVNFPMFARTQLRSGRLLFPH
jgi:hypothetical protein